MADGYVVVVSPLRDEAPSFMPIADFLQMWADAHLRNPDRWDSVPAKYLPYLNTSVSEKVKDE